MLLKNLARLWRHALLVVIVVAPRLYLLSVFDVELSQDGFDAVNTLAIWQARDIAAIPPELVDRFILHPLYMLLLAGLRIATPASVDFYLTARLLSTGLACLAVGLLFDLVRREYGAIAAWIAAVLLAFAPSFLWESISILSSTLFLVFYLAVLFTLVQSHFRLAALFAFLGALTRYEGGVLIALTLGALFLRDLRAHKFHLRDWIVCATLALAFPLTLITASFLATGKFLEFISAQSMASIWLSFLAPGDFASRAAFFLTGYPALFPTPIVWLGIGGAFAALIWHRTRATGILFLTSLLYLVFYEILVFLRYTTLEVRFLMYPGLPLLLFAGSALARVEQIFAIKFFTRALITLCVIALVGLSVQQGLAGMRFVYNMHASQREVADELAQIIPPHQPTRVMAYGGITGALGFYARPHDLDLTFVFFRFAPDDHPEQYVVDHQIEFIVYPVGNAFAKAKYPYLAQFETQTHRGVTFQPLTQFATTLDNQRYYIFSVTW